MYLLIQQGAMFSGTHLQRPQQPQQKVPQQQVFIHPPKPQTNTGHQHIVDPHMFMNPTNDNSSSRRTKTKVEGECQESKCLHNKKEWKLIYLPLHWWSVAPIAGAMIHESTQGVQQYPNRHTTGSLKQSYVSNWYFFPSDMVVLLSLIYFHVQLWIQLNCVLFLLVGVEQEK